jgi:putative heme-binding domain-containing protein
MIWYGLIPVVLQTPEKLVDLAAESKMPQIRKWTARRFAEIVAEKPECLNALLAKTANAPEHVRREIVLGIDEGLAGVRQAKRPAAWTDDYIKGLLNGAVIGKVQTINVIFGDGRAVEQVKALALDDKADIEQRKVALRSVITAAPQDLRTICEKLLKVRFLNVVALEGLVKFDDAGPAIAKAYRTFHFSERDKAVAALCSRASFAAVLLAEVEKGAIARTDITAAQARQVRSFNNAELSAKLAKVWGEFRDSPKDKLDLMAKLKADLTPEHLKAADASAGRAVFAKTCQSCHKMYGVGEAIGPDLTGAQRKDLDYLLMNMVDPSAVVAKDYQVTTFTLRDGRVLNGVIAAEAPTTVTIQLEKEKITVPKADIEKRTPSTLSLMPEGQLTTLTPQEIRNLVKYLQSHSQVDLP